MKQIVVSLQEQENREQIIRQARELIKENIQIETEDETSLVTCFGSFLLQISFCGLHPLMVFCFARELKEPLSREARKTLNCLNVKGVLGCFAVSETGDCYIFRATHWLDSELTADRFFEIVNRCGEEAARGYKNLTSNRFKDGVSAV